MRRRGVFVNGPRLVELYRRRGWSQLDLAGKSGLDVRTIAKVKKGGACDASTLQRLAIALNVTPEALMQTEAQQAKPSQSVSAAHDSIEPHVEQTDLKLMQVWTGTQFELAPIHLLFVNSFHADGFQWWQTRIAFEIESLIIQVLFADNLRCKRIQGGVAWREVQN